MSLRRRDPRPGLSHDQVIVSPTFEPPPAHRDGLRRLGALRSMVVRLSGAGQGPGVDAVAAWGWDHGGFSGSRCLGRYAARMFLGIDHLVIAVTDPDGVGGKAAVR